MAISFEFVEAKGAALTKIYIKKTTQTKNDDTGLYEKSETMEQIGHTEAYEIRESLNKALIAAKVEKKSRCMVCGEAKGKIVTKSFHKKCLKHLGSE